MAGDFGKNSPRIRKGISMTPQAIQQTAIQQTDNATPPGPIAPLHAQVLDSLASAAYRQSSALEPDLALHAHDIIRAQQERIAYLETLSTTDEITGIFNRRGFIQQLERQLAAAERYGETGVIGLCDLDRFKWINDHHGHHAGDRALRFAADVLVASTRRTDVVARIGGDEFGIILANTSMPNGRARINSIDRLLATARFDLDGIALRLRASFGIEAYRAGMTVTDIMCRADQAMYDAKRRRETIETEARAKRLRRAEAKVVMLASARGI